MAPPRDCLQATSTRRFPTCRFRPICSAHAIEIRKRHGPLRDLVLRS
ncbi:membrane protein insertion efficiency factor YidD [Nisaea acidiphila]